MGIIDIAKKRVDIIAAAVICLVIGMLVGQPYPVYFHLEQSEKNSLEDKCNIEIDRINDSAYATEKELTSALKSCNERVKEFIGVIQEYKYDFSEIIEQGFADTNKSLYDLNSMVADLNC